ncbi:VCBS repeat-containing protein [Myxococcaceae bacterium JPH2]|nr:VCBS repeat-containing protein [Myxococcaceae bacterium JPH2]
MRAAIAGLLLALASTRAGAAGTPLSGAVNAQTLKLPDGPGSVRGLVDTPQVNVFSSQVSYELPFELPKGTGGLAPALGLSYSGDLGNGPVGIGWALSSAAIRRSLRQGVPSYGAADELELVGIGGGGQLVALPDGVSWRLEGQGQSVKVARDGAGFVVTDGAGVRYRLGLTAGARMEEGTRVASWYLEEVVHPTGASLQLTYMKDANQVYLSRIAWGPSAAYSADLVYVARADRAVSWRTGFKVETGRRLSEVRVNAFGEALRVYQLTYDTSFAISRLAKVKQLGRGRVDALPELTLQYAAKAATAQVTQVEASGGWVLNQAGVSVMDVDGDGMSDLLRLDQGVQSWRKGAGTSFGPERPLLGASGAVLNSVRLVDTDGDVRPELVMPSQDGWQLLRLEGDTFQPVGRWLGTEGLTLMDPGLFIADFNGDGRVDLLRTGAETLSIKWNGPNGLGAWQTKPAVDGFRLMPGPNARLHEVNGDGLADVVQLGSTSVTVYQGKGDGTFAAGVTYAYPWSDTVLDLGSLRLCDLNRDGIMDVVRLSGANLSWYAGLAQGGFSTTARDVARPAADGASVIVATADLNGNGSEDVVWSAPDGMWLLDMAGATSAGMLTGITNGLGKSVAVSYEGSAKLAVLASGAGQPWTRLLPMSIPVPVTLSVVPGAGSPTRNIEYTVRDGFWDAEERRFGGFLVGGVRTLGATAADTLYEETRFHPGLGGLRVLRGMPLEVRTQDGTGRLFRVQTSTYEARPVQGLPDIPWLRKAALVETRTLHHDGLTTPIETLTTYAYDARVRAIEQRDLGRLDVTGDERTMQRVYASDDTAWIQDVVCEETLREGDGTLVSQRRMFYGDATQVFTWTDPAACQAGRLMRETRAWLADAVSPRWVLESATEYDAWDNPTRMYSKGSWRTLTYDANHLYPVSESTSPAVGRTLTWAMEWDNVLGQPRRLTSPDGIVTEVTYDTLGRPTTMARAGAQPHLRYVYDWSAPQPKTFTYDFDGAPSALAGSWTGAWVDGGPWRQSVAVSNGAGERLYSAQRLTQGRWAVSDWLERDARGRVVYAAEPVYVDGALPVSRPVGAVGQGIAYDALGRMVTQTLPTGDVRTLTYQAFETTQSETDLTPVTTRMDGLGRILRTQRQVGSTLESVDASYDAAGRIRSLALQGGLATHSFSYDTLGRMVSAQDPDVGPRTLRYNDFGWLTHHTNAAGQTRQFFYDLLGRLTRAQGEDGSGFDFHYDVAKDGTSTGYVPGRLAWVTEPRGEVHYRYDVYGNNEHQSRSVDGVWADESTVFSPSGLVLSSVVDGVPVDTTYDAIGRPTRVGTFWQATQLDAAGRVLDETYGNGVRQLYTRDALGLAQRIQTLRSTGVALYDVTLTRTAYGAPRTVEDADGVGLNHSATFTYDSAARLTDMVLGAVKQPDGTLAQGPASYRFSYQYDGLQNMVQRQAQGPQSLGILAGTHHYGERGFGPRQLTRVATASGDVLMDYDAAGRLVSQGGRLMQYNGLDQLTRVTLPGATPTFVDHAYGHDGQRVFTQGPDGLPEYSFSPQLSQRAMDHRERYVRLGDRVLARLNQSVPVSGGALALRPGMGSASGVSQDVAVGRLFSGLVVAALGLVYLAALRWRTTARPGWVRAMAGSVAVALLGSACGPGLQAAGLSAQRQAVLDSTATLYFHGGIAAGPALITRADGSVFEERRYEPFGASVDAYRELVGGGAAVGAIDHHAEPLNTLNKRTDWNTGWSDHGARWMAPETGRWLTPDSLAKAPDPKFLDAPWSLHPYQYVRQNPVLFWDPDGRQELPFVPSWQPPPPPPGGGLPITEPVPFRLPMQMPSWQPPVPVTPPVPAPPLLEAPPSTWRVVGGAILNAVRAGGAAVGGVLVVLWPSNSIATNEQELGPRFYAQGGNQPAQNTTTHYQGPNAAPERWTPNSVWETTYPNGNRRVTYYDEAGNTFTREDYGQEAPHKVEINGVKYNLNKVPHEHRLNTVQGPKGEYKKHQVRILDDNGNPKTGWVNSGPG